MTTKVPAELSSTPSITDSGNATAITIDSSENVLIGTTTINSGTLGTSNKFLEVSAGTASGSGTLILSRNTSTNNVELGGVRFVNANNADDDGLDADGKLVAAVSARSVTSDSNAGDDSGADLIFYTKPEAGNYAERARFLSSGGLTFNGDTAAANALDDYEEGTYTPVMNSSNLTYDYQAGWYVKIGSHVTVGIHIDINSNGNGSGVAIGDISLPFAPSLGGANYYAMTSTIWCNGWSTATKSDVGLVSHNYSYIVTRKAAGQGGVATPTHGDLGGGNMLMTVSYQTA